MEKYETLQIEIVVFESEDIITASNPRDYIPSDDVDVL